MHVIETRMSDGLLFGGMAGNMLGSEGLSKIVEELDISRPDETIPDLVERIRLQQPDNLSRDDATILLFRADGSNPSLTENLLAPLRLLSRVRDNTGIN